MGIAVDFPLVFHKIDFMFFHNCGKLLIVLILAL